MSNIFTLENVGDFTKGINIDDLYEKKRQKDLNQLVLFDKLLNRIHVRIKNISRQKIDEQFSWFLVPETILGVPKYEQASCIAYLMDKLKNNGFSVRYIHPNLLFISWHHWVPSYVRNEIKKKTGVNINEYGQKMEDDIKNDIEQPIIENITVNPNEYLLNKNDNLKVKSQKKDYTPINSYKPSGNLVYDDDLLNKIKNKFI